MGSQYFNFTKMIHWLIKAPFYLPLSFEAGVAGSAVSIALSHISLKIFQYFYPFMPTEQSFALVRLLRFVIRPIRQFELLLQDEQYTQIVQLSVLGLLAFLGVAVVILSRYRKLLRKASKNQPHKLQAETKRLLSERKQFISKVDQLEKLNKRYREAVFLAEKSYNEEHKLKRLEEKRLKNLEKYMDQCSKAISSRKDRLNSTLKNCK